MKASFLRRIAALGAAAVMMAGVIPATALAGETDEVSSQLVETQTAQAQIVDEASSEADLMAATYSGTCGDNLTWSLNTSSGELVISGTGEMTTTPWKSYADSIKKVTVQKGLTGFCSGAFSNCTKLVSASIPSSVTSWGKGMSVFSGDTALTTVSIDEGVTGIGRDMFYGCTSLSQVNIPSTVTSISNEAFYGCSALTSVTIPEGCKSIGMYAFFGTGIKEVTIPSTLTGTKSICAGAFSACKSLASVTILAPVTLIDIDAFRGCSSLKSIYIPSSVTSISSNAFEGCTALSQVRYGGSASSKANIQIDGYASGNSPLTNATWVYSASPASFSDVADPSSWYYSYIYRAKELGVMSGYSDGSGAFGPDDKLSRGMVVTLLYRAYTGKTAETTSNKVKAVYSDVPSGQWYSAAVKWASQAGITTGYSDGSGKFGPNDPVTREQLATFIGRYVAYVKSGESSTDIKSYVSTNNLATIAKKADWKQVSEFAQYGMAWCNANGVLTGYNDGSNKLGPQDGATRAQMAKIIVVTVCDVLGSK